MTVSASLKDARRRLAHSAWFDPDHPRDVQQARSTTEYSEFPEYPSYRES